MLHPNYDLMDTYTYPGFRILQFNLAVLINWQARPETVFTAAMTSTLTVSKISSKVNSPQDLHQVKVGSLDHSTSAAYQNNNQIHFAGYPSVKTAIEGLLAQDIDAVVYDSPILRYLAAGEFQGRVQVLKTSFEKQQYGIALPTGSPLRESIFS